MRRCWVVAIWGKLLLGVHPGTASLLHPVNVFELTVERARLTILVVWVSFKVNLVEVVVLKFSSYFASAKGSEASWPLSVSLSRRSEVSWPQEAY